ncbi:hypothetical protein [Streptacidiphilus anmyonensis]|uniref:hypothetical protein n=1 Tax=Streptacidiphilus anmyonensis TaxID=405782 RepID=UPI0005AB5B13|nr:hypothetical protein [Streptacidiphilus anmyonensis]
MSTRRASARASSRAFSSRALSSRGAASLVAATSLAAVGLAVAAAGPAFAKSSIALQAGARSVTPGERIALSARGSSDDFGGHPVRLCLDERVGHGPWRAVDCGREGVLRVTVRAAHPGMLAFRAQLVGRDAHGRMVVDRTSEVVTVRVR